MAKLLPIWNKTLANQKTGPKSLKKKHNRLYYIAFTLQKRYIFSAVTFFLDINYIGIVIDFCCASLREFMVVFLHS